MGQGRKPGLRIATAERRQISFDLICLDDSVPEDHRVRQVVAYVEKLDLSPLYQTIRAVVGGAGRDAIDPVILMSLWLYATLEGVGSARLLDRLCERDLIYRWIRGGVGVNYHTLSDFRTKGAAVLDGLLTTGMAALADAGIVGLECLAVDGVRVRASAGASSFRRAERLAELREASATKIAALRAEIELDPTAAETRLRQRRLHAAETAKARIEAAQRATEEITQERQLEAERQRRKEPKQTGPARGSTTDADARVMKMADGGFRPAYNVQVKTDVKSGCILGIEVTNKASDRDQLEVAVREVQERYRRGPKRVLADAGYDGKDGIERLYERRIEVFCPVPRSGGKPVPALAKPGEGPGVQAWRERMSREESYEIYRERFACERPHAEMRNRGLRQFLVRGIEKVKAVALWHATAFNFLQILRLAPEFA
jgi:transposase